MAEASGNRATAVRTETGRDVESRYADFLQSRGMRQTRQRKLLLETVFSSQSPFDMEQLLSRLGGKPSRESGSSGATGAARRRVAASSDGSRSISRPTVYRAVGELVAAGLLRKLEVEGRTVYQPVQSPAQSDHMHCTQCRRLIPFQSGRIAAAIRDSATECQFLVKGHQLIVEGLCAECRASRRRIGRPVDRI